MAPTALCKNAAFSLREETSSGSSRSMRNAADAAAEVNGGAEAE